MNLLHQVLRSKKGIYVYIHISFTEFADWMINHLFNKLEYVYISVVMDFIPRFRVKSPVWLHIRPYLRVDRIIIDNVDYLKYHALLNRIWAPIDTLYR